MIDTTNLTPRQRAALVAELEGFAEGMDENLRDDYWGREDECPEEFPVVEDMRKAAFCVRESLPVDELELEVVADADPQGAEPDLVAALAALGVPLGYRGT